MKKTHYNILGVSEDASEKEIKEKYKELVLKYHPDKVKSQSKYMKNKFNEITEAYATLSDSYKRDVYDDELDRERNGDFNTRFTGTPNTKFNVNGNLNGNKQFTEAMKILNSVFKNNFFSTTNNDKGTNDNQSNNPFDQPFFRNPQKFMEEAMKNGGNSCNTTSFTTSTTHNNYDDKNNDSENLLSSDDEYEYHNDSFDLDSDDTFGEMDQEEYYRSRCDKKNK